MWRLNGSSVQPTPPPARPPARVNTASAHSARRDSASCAPLCLSPLAPPPTFPPTPPSPPGTPAPLDAGGGGLLAPRPGVHPVLHPPPPRRRAAPRGEVIDSQQASAGRGPGAARRQAGLAGTARRPLNRGPLNQARPHTQFHSAALAPQPAANNKVYANYTDSLKLQFTALAPQPAPPAPPPDQHKAAGGGLEIHKSSPPHQHTAMLVSPQAHPIPLPPSLTPAALQPLFASRAHGPRARGCRHGTPGNEKIRTRLRLSRTRVSPRHAGHLDRVALVYLALVPPLHLRGPARRRHPLAPVTPTSPRRPSPLSFAVPSPWYGPAHGMAQPRVWPSPGYGPAHGMAQSSLSPGPHPAPGFHPPHPQQACRKNRPAPCLVPSHTAPRTQQPAADQQARAEAGAGRVPYLRCAGAGGGTSLR